MHKHFLLDLHLDYIKEINKLFALYAKEITRDLVCQIKTRTGWILDSYETYIRQKKIGLWSHITTQSKHLCFGTYKFYFLFK